MKFIIESYFYTYTSIYACILRGWSMQSGNNWWWRFEVKMQALLLHTKIGDRNVYNMFPCVKFITESDFHTYIYIDVGSFLRDLTLHEWDRWKRSFECFTDSSPNLIVKCPRPPRIWYQSKECNISTMVFGVTDKFQKLSR